MDQKSQLSWKIEQDQMEAERSYLRLADNLRGGLLCVRYVGFLLY